MNTGFLFLFFMIQTLCKTLNKTLCKELYKVKRELDLNSSSGNKLHRSLQCLNVSQPALCLRQEDIQSGEHSSSDEEDEERTNETVQKISSVDRKEQMSKHSINDIAVSSPGSSKSQDTDVTSHPVGPTQFVVYNSKAASFADLLRRGSRFLLFSRLFQRGRSSSEGTSLLKDQSERDDKPTKREKKVKRDKKKGWRTNQSKPVGEKEMKTEPYAAVAQGFNNVITANKPMDTASATMGDNSIPARDESMFINNPTQAPAVVTSILDQVTEIDLSQVDDDIMLIREQTSQLNKLGQSISQMIKCGQQSRKKE
ncbi:hypothetical protein CHS0354_021552 [Potamilus streckersoni]|uniref:t-SNARE coiled-coil homology domain-containing protein n=1 Tax=Potamilus streckersoni TaxID=2493646 RepID=A0AAE0SNL3_9BIVA|nr:hypothetical protein CHS0354_021552 [Potamilus streckersoni]